MSRPSHPLAATKPLLPKRPPPDTEGGPESLLPGERSGEGSQDLFKHIQRDIRRRASGVPPVRKKPDDGQS